MDAVVSYDGGYDAVILGGFGEHGKEGLAELLEVPVFDIAECAAHVAMLLGRTYAIVTTLPRSIAQIEDRLLLAGLSARCATVLATGRTTRGLEDDPPAALAEIIDASRLAVRRDGAEVVVLGCGGMAGWAAEVSSAVGVPVVDGIPAAVALAEGVVGLGLRTSKVGAYAPPPGNVVTGWPLSRRGVQG
jgi:allantoin racemase